MIHFTSKTTIYKYNIYHVTHTILKRIQPKGMLEARTRIYKNDNFIYLYNEIARDQLMQILTNQLT